jgi:hypothetical protein
LYGLNASQKWLSVDSEPDKMKRRVQRARLWFTLEG